MTGNVVCHIGLHKTASGTLQRQFFPACKGIRLFTTQHGPTSHFVREITCTDPAFFSAAEAGALLEPHLIEGGINLISNESLSGPPYAGLIEHGLDHRTPVLQNLRSVFPDARIVIVLRRQDDLARSLYRQYLKRGGTERIDRFYGVSKSGKPPLMSLNRFKYSPYLDLLSTLFPAGMGVLLFEDFIGDRQAFLGRLCEFLGIEQPSIDLRVENATKLGPFGMEASRWANYLFRSMVNKGPLPAIPRKQFGRWRLVSPVEYLHDYWPGGGRPSTLIESVSRRVLAEVAEDNRAVDVRFNLNLVAKGYY